MQLISQNLWALILYKTHFSGHGETAPDLKSFAKKTICNYAGKKKVLLV